MEGTFAEATCLGPHERVRAGGDGSLVTWWKPKVWGGREHAVFLWGTLVVVTVTKSPGEGE